MRCEERAGNHNTGEFENVFSLRWYYDFVFEFWIPADKCTNGTLVSEETGSAALSTTDIIPLFSWTCFSVLRRGYTVSYSHVQARGLKSTPLLRGYYTVMTVFASSEELKSTHHSMG